jgi:hypothetical protein
MRTPLRLVLSYVSLSNRNMALGEVGQFSPAGRKSDSLFHLFKPLPAPFAAAQGLETVVESRTRTFGPANFVGENLIAAGCFEVVYLKGQVLVVCAHSRVSDKLAHAAPPIAALASHKLNRLSSCETLILRR